MSFLKKILNPANILALARGVRIKMKYGRKASFPFGKVYFGEGFKINISGNGQLNIRAKGGDGRVYFSRNCSVTISNGEVNIGEGVFFNENCRITSHVSVTIGSDCLFGYNVNIFDSDHKFADGSRKIRYQGYEKLAVSIGSDCWLGSNAVITKGSQLANHSVVAANCVFNLKNSRAGGVYGGAPAKLLKIRADF
jgi:acetyltransferase-like isoleucine patch superfamily enzyme